jgi:hypothetical protein
MFRKKWLIALILAFLAGCASFGTMADREGTYGTGAPVIVQSFASPQVRPGDNWKVYLNASDPNGDMRDIVAVIEQTGVGSYSASYTRVKTENRKDFSGYIYLSTTGPSPIVLNWVNLKLILHVRDMAGHFSEPVVLPLSFSTRAMQSPPPEGLYKEQNLGPIMTQLRTLDGGSRER